MDDRRNGIIVAVCRGNTEREVDRVIRIRTVGMVDVFVLRKGVVARDRVDDQIKDRDAAGRTDIGIADNVYIDWCAVMRQYAACEGAARDERAVWNEIAETVGTVIDIDIAGNSDWAAGQVGFIDLFYVRLDCDGSAIDRWFVLRNETIWLKDRSFVSELCTAEWADIRIGHKRI